MRGPLARYRTLVETGALEADPAQEAAAERLQHLHEALSSRGSLLGRLMGGGDGAARGLYLWGGVGRGKSLLMDLFFNNTGISPKRRAHFHEFMAEIHERIADFRALDERSRRKRNGVNRKAPDDPIAPVAHDIAREARLLCFDELQVSDIADASILGRLFEALFAAGVVVVATSNRHPDDLYKDGLNRQRFLPFIDMFKRKLEIVEIQAARDYRLARLAGAPVYYAPLGPVADAAMDAAWSRLICGATEREEHLDVKGRTLTIRRAARGAARFDFDELCARALGAADYIALARRYGTIFMDRIPAMEPAMRNEAKRFVTLVDAVYEARTKFVCSAASEPEGLYLDGDGAFEFARAASRLMEMRSTDYLGAEHVAPAAAE